MSLEIKGIDKLLKQMEYLDINIKKASVTAVNKALEDTLDDLKRIAPKDTGESRKHLSIDGKGAKKYRKSTWGKMGITSENWSKTKGLYFNHHGFINHINGKKVTKHIGWMDRAGEKILPKAENIIINELNKEIKKHL